MVQLAALAVNPPTFDPVRSTLAGASLLGQQIQSATALENLRTAPERHALAVEHARRQNALAELQVAAARRDQGALAAFAEQGGLGNPSALRALQGNPQLFTGALQGYTAHANWRNTQNAQGAQRVLAYPPGSQDRVRAWRQELESALAQQRIDQNTFAQLSARDPDDATLQRIIDMARPPGAEPTLQEILRTGLPGGPPPGGGQGQTFAGLTPLALGLRAQAGLDPSGFGVTPPDRGATMDLPSYLFNLREQAGLNVSPADVATPTTPPPAVGVTAPPPGSPPLPPAVLQRLLRGEGGPQPATLGVEAPVVPPAPAPKGSPGNPYRADELPGLPASVRDAAGVHFLDADGRLMRSAGPGTAPVPVEDAPGAQGGPMVYGWPGDAGAETVPTSGPPSVPGVTIGQPGDAVGTPGVNLLGGAGGPPRPPAGPENVGQVIGRVLGSATQAQRARFWTLMSRAGTRDDAMKLLQEIESGGAPLTASQRAERAASLRTEIRTIGSQFTGMQDAAGLIETALENLRTNPSTPGPWDVSMVINYMKMLDPTSVVREGEYETARRTAGIPDQVWSWYQRAVSGAQLPSSVRTEIGRVSRSLLTVRREDFLRMQRQYTGIAERMGINPQDVILDLTRPDSAPGGSRQATLLDEARQAIAGGAPADAVRARLRDQHGIDPALLDR